MTDPNRWSEAVDQETETERMLLHAGQALRMPNDEKQAVWNRILGALPPIGPNAPGEPAIAGSSGSLVALKTLGLVVVLSGLAAVGHHWLKKASPPVAQDSTPPSMASPAPSTSAKAIEVSAPEAASTTVPAISSAAAATPQATALSPASQLREESLAVMAARQALRTNDAKGALRLLDQAQRRFGKGGLAEEREALTIEALAKSGQTARASSRAAAFLRNHPRSPHATDVQRFAEK